MTFPDSLHLLKIECVTEQTQFCLLDSVSLPSESSALNSV